MWFNINYNKLAVIIQPTFLRKSVMTALIRSLIQPINGLYYDWYQFRKANLYKLAHTGQVCYLRKVLNDAFDPQERRIRIGNGQRFDRLYIYTHAELKPARLGTIYLHPRSDYADTGVDFIVYVPSALPELLNSKKYEINALIDFYKEGVKRYKIIAE